MDEVITSKSFGEKLLVKILRIFILEPVSFSNKKRLNFRGMAGLSCVFFGFFLIWVLATPAPEAETQVYSESRSIGQSEASEQPTTAGSPRNSLNPLSTAALRGSSGYIGSAKGGNSEVNRNVSMIITRENDSSTTLPPGTKLSVRLEQNVSVTTGGMPVIGRITASVMSRSSLAIPEGSLIFGDATLDDSTERAQIAWKSILFPDGRSKNLSAIALGSDNQAGLLGDYHSDALKNTTGQMISRFVGAFAEGSVSHGALGASEGGLKNGLLQGISETAKDRTEAWSEDLKKPRAWIELAAGLQFQVIISQPFQFRDPGGVY